LVEAFSAAAQTRPNHPSPRPAKKNCTGIHTGKIVLTPFLPQSVDGLHALIQSTLVSEPPKPGGKVDDIFADPSGKEIEEISASNLPDNLADLREIILASWGIAPSRERVRSFVSKQVWYVPDKNATKDALTPKQKRILNELDQLTAKAHQ
jgi:hypothetical protein